MNCPHCGNQLSDGAKFCNGCGAAVENATGHSSAPPPLPEIKTGGDDWTAFFQSLSSEMLDVSCLSPNRFSFSGERKVKALLSRTKLRYKAAAHLDAAAKVLQWWEKLTESSFGLAPENSGFTSESHRQKGNSLAVRKTVKTIGGGYSYDYGDLRSVVENEAMQRGWKFELLVSRPRD